MNMDIKGLHARQMFYMNLDNWRREGKIRRDELGIYFLVKLFGYASKHQLRTGMTQDQMDLCIKMSGPNGWTVYKTFLARKGIKNENE